MASDKDFIDNAIEVLKTVGNAVRRGQISGPIVDVLNFSLVNIGGESNRPLSLHRRPVRFAVPTNFNLQTGAKIMAAINIRGDVGTRIPVEFDNLAGTAVPDPSGEATVTCSNTAIATTRLDLDGHSVLIFPVQPATDTSTFTLTYVDGNITFTGDFAISPDVTAVAGHFVDSQMTNVPLETAPPPAAA